MKATQEFRFAAAVDSALACCGTACDISRSFTMQKMRDEFKRDHAFDFDACYALDWTGYMPAGSMEQGVSSGLPVIRIAFPS